jgi:alpha-tubulin suppressor-like RCC1 family protein
MPGAVSLPEKVTCVAAGGSQTFAVTLSGKVYGWGCYKDKEGKQWFDAPGALP